MASSGFSPAAPPVFNAPLRANPTVAQISQHAAERTKRHKAMSCIQNCVSNVIFTRIMACETPKQAWDKLKEEFQGIERTKQQQLINLRRDFENFKMKEEEIVKQYSDRIMTVVNSIRLLGEQFSEARIVEKVLSTLPERYEAKISSLKDSRDLETISLTELINALYAQEQMRASRMEEHQEGAFQAKAKAASSTSAYKGHVERVCKEKGRPGQNQQHKAEAQVAEEGSDNEEQVFAVSCSTTQKKVSNVKVGNGHFIKAEGKGDVVICTPTGNKIISNVLLVPEIERNLFSIAQLVEKGYNVVFKENEFQISDPSGSMLMSVAMTEKSFVVDWNKGFDNAYAVSSEDSKLWHQRLGHANFRSMT
ncbi:uncharacterized protein [Gossypium hirsutum]|uniref:Retrovirus-related Pol polyprotein from transposon TNT 1-94-like beta-barrel domain-containing protein n=1 Tax=Gossypium hirsutum TaxID=3635 RepID=A0A1U8IDT1_GOSHI|nr:uncharacterized protein LOC107895605 [Gossypium hirsutum]